VEDKILNCKDCGNEFVFSVREQHFFTERGFANQPLRCRECRQARRAQSGDQAPVRTGNRPTYDAICAECKTETTVPFRPRGDRPVYCRTCYSTKVLAGV
jgi:CxxC-x17-CxxC domain-containing protein